MRDIYKILDGTSIEVKSELFCHQMDFSVAQTIVESICDSLKQMELFEKAIQVAKRFSLPVGSIILDVWKTKFRSEGTLSTEKCEADCVEYDLKYEILIAFYYSIANDLPQGSRDKYIWIKNAINAMQNHNLYHLDWITLDQLEKQLILAYLKLEKVDDIPIHHSAYHENVMKIENYLLYVTFPELQTIAQLDDLIVEPVELTKEERLKLIKLIDSLLDESDIVQALRLQTMFDCKTTDMKNVLFAMEIAENITPLFKIPLEQRQHLIGFGMKGKSRKLSKRTLLPTKFGSSPQSSPIRTNVFEGTDSSGYEYEEIPSREKQDTCTILQSLCAKIKHGEQICERILKIYRASMYMEQSYDIYLRRKDCFSLLSDVIATDCFNKLQVVDDLIGAAKMTPDEIVSFISLQLAESIIKSRFYLFQSSPTTEIKNTLWGFDLDKDFRYFLSICEPNNSLFGTTLLLYCEGLNIYRTPSIYTDRKNPRLNLVITNIQCILQDKVLSQKKQNTIQIELLIKAHQCFLNDCSVEGIAEVLQKAKALVNVLANAKSWNLIIRLLTGIGSYKEMFYCFDILVSNEQFVPLIKKCMEEKRRNLQNALMSYLRDHYPSNKHYFETAAAYFSLYSDLGDLYTKDADTIVAAILNSNLKNIAYQSNSDRDPYYVTYIKSSKDILISLQSAMDLYASAAELYLLDNKLSSAQIVTGKAELIALQMCLINQGHGKYGSFCILTLENEPKLVNFFVNAHFR